MNRPPTILLLFAAAPALAQSVTPQPPSADAPPLRHEAPAPIKPVGPSGIPERIKPADSTIPGLEDADFRVKPAPMRREGTFILRQRGSLLKLPDGQRAIIFHPDVKGKSERPMVLAPSQELQRMEQLAADHPSQVAFSVSGEVLSYKGVNYLLIPSGGSVVVREGSDPDAAPAHDAPAESHAAEVPSTPGSPSATTTELNEPGVPDLIRRLEAQRERPRTVEPGIPLPTPDGAPSTTPPEPGEPAGAQADSVPRIIPEGKTVVRRRGRMVRAGSGEWSIVFDSGPKGETEIDRPMLLVPCLNLQRMEAWAATKGDSASMEVSGQVLTYQGRNYLLPTLYHIDTIREMEPRQ